MADKFFSDLYSLYVVAREVFAVILGICQALQSRSSLSLAGFLSLLKIFVAPYW